MPSRSARAFGLLVHAGIVGNALRGIMDDTGIAVVGASNVVADRHQFTPEQHFDNAPSPGEPCDRWRSGIDSYLTSAVKSSAPDGDDLAKIADRVATLATTKLWLSALHDRIVKKHDRKDYYADPESVFNKLAWRGLQRLPDLPLMFEVFPPRRARGNVGNDQTWRRSRILLAYNGHASHIPCRAPPNRSRPHAGAGPRLARIRDARKSAKCGSDALRATIVYPWCSSTKERGR